MITNLTKNKVISQQEIVCNNSFSKTLGLMFRRKQNLIMIFNKEKRVSLHMFFVFYPIDVLILNKNKKIVEIKRNFKPFTFWRSKKKGMYVIELAFSSKDNVGDQIKV